MRFGKAIRSMALFLVIVLGISLFPVSSFADTFGVTVVAPPADAAVQWQPLNALFDSVDTDAGWGEWNQIDINYGEKDLIPSGTMNLELGISSYSNDYRFVGWRINGTLYDANTELGSTAYLTDEGGNWNIPSAAYISYPGSGTASGKPYLTLYGDILGDITVEPVFEAKGGAKATPAVSVAAEDAGKGAFVKQNFLKNNEDGSSTWEIVTAPESGYQLSAYSIGDDVSLYSIGSDTITYKDEQETVTIGTDEYGNPITWERHHYSSAFDVTLAADSNITLYFEPMSFSLEFDNLFTDLPRYKQIEFGGFASRHYTKPHCPDSWWKYQTLMESHNAQFMMNIQLHGCLSSSGDAQPYTLKAYKGGAADPDDLIFDYSGTETNGSYINGGFTAFCFTIKSMPTTDKITVVMTGLDGKTASCTFDVAMPHDCAELDELKAYYTDTYGLDKFGKEAYTKEEKQTEAYQRYCQNSRFRYLMRTVYNEQCRIVGTAAEADRAAALAAAKQALDDAAQGKGADAVVWVFSERTDKGTTAMPILTGVPPGSDNVKKTGINASEAMLAAMEAQYPGNWTITNTWAQFGAFVTDITAGGAGDIGGEAVSTGYSSYGCWYYNGKFSEWGVSNYYVSDGDVMCWGSYDPAFTWDWAVLRWKLGDEALTAALAEKGMTIHALTAAQLESYFSTIDFSRYGQLRTVSPVDSVIRLINAIGIVSPDSGTAIADARGAYNALDSSAQAQVTNYDTLTAAEAAYAALTQAAGVTHQTALASALTHLQNGNDLGVGSTNGEWAILALARSGAISGNDATGQAQNYLKALGDTLDKNGLDGIVTADYTTYSRIVLALSSLGIDASNFTTGKGTYNIPDKLEEYDNVVNQGVNGAAFALLALDSKPYMTADSGLRDKYVSYILNAGLSGGGWALSGSKADVDITCMVLQSLAPYKANNAAVDAAVTSGLAFLKAQQTSAGGFSSYGIYNAESTAQVIVALTELSIDPAGNGWKKGSLTPVDALLHFYDDTFGMFRHSLLGQVNQMATEQSGFALTAYNRFLQGKNALYLMSDAFNDPGVDTNADVKADVADAKTAVNGLGVQSISMISANTEAAIQNYVKNLLGTLPLKKTSVSVAVQSFTPAVAGTAGSTNGTQGSFTCAVTISKTNGTDYASDTASVSGVITATKYVPPITDTVTVTFSLLGDASHNSDKDGVRHTLKAGNLETWIGPTSVTVPKGSCVGDVFKKVLDEKGYSYVGLSGNYIKSITKPGGLTLAEFTNGNLSGWMYTLNGHHTGLGLNEQTVSDGDVIIWHYTDDYTKEEGSEKWKGSGNSSDSEAGRTVTPKATVSGGTASVSLNLTDMKDAIGNAKGNGDEIIIAPSISGSVSSMQVTLKKDALSAIAGQTDCPLAIRTPVGSVTLPNSALDSISSQAAGGGVTVNLNTVDTAKLTADQQKAVGNDTVYSIAILSGSSTITGFGGESIKISLSYTLKEGEDPSGVTVWYLNDAGKLEKMACTYDRATGLATFKTAHLSYYVVGYAAAWTNPFADIKTTDWYYDAVKYVSAKKLMSGTSASVFEPNVPMTRSMLVAVLYRLEGSPAVSGASVAGADSFSDVKSGQWYADAVAWSNANGIAAGIGNGLFGTNNNVTREQLAAILYNYAKYKGYDVTKTAGLNSFADASAIRGWALPAVKWANAEGLINGRTADTIVPGGSASRAEVAAILQRFIEGVE